MIIQQTGHNLLQLKDVLSQLNNQEFSAPLDVLNGSSIGMHVRHILEFYLCLLDSKQSLKVNYDCRKRDILLETNTGNCIKTISRILVNINEIENDFVIELSANYSANNDDDVITLNSTFYRELIYNVEHTVHHLAIIKIGLKEIATNILVDEGFGVAASTIRNKNLCAQ